MSRMKPNDLTKIIQKLPTTVNACNYRNYNVCGQILLRKSLMMPSFMVVPGIHMDTHKPEVWICAKQSRSRRGTHACLQNQPRGPFSCEQACAADRVAVSQLRGVALQCRGSVPSRSTDSERVWDRPYSPKSPLLARPSRSPRRGVRHEGARRNQCVARSSPPSHREPRAGLL